jgi:hypothetical protein
LLVLLLWLLLVMIICVLPACMLTAQGAAVCCNEPQSLGHLRFFTHVSLCVHASCAGAEGGLARGAGRPAAHRVAGAR